jgi:hypothetical protein
MSALVQTSFKNHSAPKGYPELWKKVSWAKVAEVFWFSTSFALSIALGPFAAIPVLIAVFSMPRIDNGLSEPESL